MVRSKKENKVRTSLEMAPGRMNLDREFNPKLRFYELEYYLDRRSEKSIRNDSLYRLARRLAYSAYPSSEDEFEKRWDHFLLPVKRSGKFISLPFGMMEYRKVFYVFIQGLGSLSVGRGKEKVENIYRKILEEAIRFSCVFKRTGSEMTKTVPYDIRTGKIKGKYIMRSVMPTKEKDRILASYKKHLGKGLKTSGTSLSEYLRIAGICYRAAYGEKTKGLSDEHMYRKWADGRDSWMLSITGRDSEEAYAEWLSSRSFGGHPFEIVFSWHRHGIHLYPPDKDRLHFMIAVTNYGYADDFLKMVKALKRESIPFEALRIEEVLEFLTGETYFTVNEYDDHFFHYMPSKEYKDSYFRHVEWDNINIVRFK